ncbi:MAG: alanine--tRNA ligase-related protein [candidate division KSB1 bacterium]|nr:alanine--tRNA ligase-related protein [candidate division KSB1 bacterium]MDZ7317785.1 alanine--tRNA ligase-related protein [candidate division KSB1 bacterium]
MITQKLYLDQTKLIHFPATILRTFPHGSQHAIILDQTAFYPTSGGQMNDTGTINGIEVVDVIEQDGEILHLVQSPLEVGKAECQINWPRRFDFMQQHTGFHILARSFFNLFGTRTISSHLGEESSTIDVDLLQISDDQIQAVEDLAQQIIFEDRLVKAYWARPADVDKKKLRKELVEREDIRLVEIDGFDVDPCGGTHVAATGQVGLVKIIAWEKIRGYWRLEFLAGGRAIRDYQKKWRRLRQLSALLSTGEDDLANSVEKLQTEIRELIRKSKKIMEQNIVYEASELVTEAQKLGQKIMVRIFDDKELNEARFLARQIVKVANIGVLFGLRSEKAYIILAAPETWSHNFNVLVPQVAPIIDGRGGGRPTFVEIGGNNASALTEAMEMARAMMEKMIS